MARGAPTLAGIDRFIPDDSPIGRAGGAGMLYRATGSLEGAAALAAIARKESEFGRTSGRFRNNAWGWGVHLGPDVNTAPDWETMAGRVWRGLSGNLYKGAGLTTLPEILMRYAPPSENDTELYKRQVGGWMTEMGFSPQTDIFTGSVSPGGALPAPARGGARLPASPAAAPGGGRQITAESIALIRDYAERTRRQVLAGQMPESSAGVASRLRFTPGAAPAAPADPSGGHAPGDGHDHGAGAPPASGTYGFPTGGVDSGRVYAGGAGGDWGGSLALALQAAKFSGLPITSQKRSRQLTASGGVSDHWQGSTSSYAVDLGTSGSAGDAAYARLLNRLGFDPARYPSGTWQNINRNGYRYQIGWRTPGHFDHIHVGVKRI